MEEDNVFVGLMDGIAPVGYVGTVVGVSRRGSKEGFIALSDGSSYGDRRLVRVVPCEFESAEQIFEAYKKKLVAVALDEYGFLKLRAVYPMVDILSK